MTIKGRIFVAPLSICTQPHRAEWYQHTVLATVICIKGILAELYLFTPKWLASLEGLKMKSINYEAPVKCSKSIMIEASSVKVWTVMTDINNWSTWQTDITKPKLNGELKPGSRFDWNTGGARIHSTLHTVEPFQYFGWTGKTFGMYAIHNWVLTEINRQTKVSVDESMEGFFAKLFKKSFNKNLEKGMERWLNFLKKECEK